jgi:hypothetical protein
VPPVAMGAPPSPLHFGNLAIHFLNGLLHRLDGGFELFQFVGFLPSPDRGVALNRSTVERHSVFDFRVFSYCASAN